MAQPQSDTPNADDLTRSTGRQYITELEGLIGNPGFDQIHQIILGTLDNLDFNKLRRTSRMYVLTLTSHSNPVYPGHTSQHWLKLSIQLLDSSTPAICLGPVF